MNNRGLTDTIGDNNNERLLVIEFCGLNRLFSIQITINFCVDNFKNCERKWNIYVRFLYHLIWASLVCVTAKVY